MRTVSTGTIITAAVLLLSLILPVAARAADSGLSVLTYNVHGLPWPLTFGRPAAFAKIETRLRAMRHEGVQPHIVVLQEAFTADAKQIGRRSGYRYIVDGPGRALRSPAPETPADAAFAARASFWRGESGAKLVDSGLQILSDYPVLSVRRAASARVYPHSRAITRTNSRPDRSS